MAEPRALNPYNQPPVPGIRQPVVRPNDRPSAQAPSSEIPDFVDPLDTYTPSSGATAATSPTLPADTIDQSQALYPQDRTGSLGSDAFIGLTESGLMNGQNVSWLLVNFSGVKWINDHWGHEAGNAYLLRVKAILEETIGAPVQIVRQGPNFAVLLPENVDAAAVMRSLEGKLRAGVDFTYLRRHSDGRAEIVPASYTAATEGRSRIFNQELLVYDATQQYSFEAIFAGLREETYYLNRPEMEYARYTIPQLIGNGLFQMVILDPQRLSTLNLEERLVGSEIPAYREDAIGSLTENRSGSENVRALEGDALNLLLESGRTQLAVIDLNAIGAFRSLGPLGDLMIDAVLEVRVLEAAQVLEGTGITLYRHGGGSEEYYLAGDVSEEQMANATRQFLEALNAEPLVLRVEVSDLESTAMGRRTLEYLKETGQYQPYQHTFENGQSAQVVDVDLTRVTRGILQPDGTYKTFLGLSGTAATGEIRRPADGEILEIRPEFRNNRFGVILEAFARGRDAVMELVEQAKPNNPNRDNLIVKAGPYRGTETMFRDGAEGISPDNLLTLITHYRSNIPRGTIELYSDADGRISFEPGAGRSFSIRITIIDGPQGAPYLQSLEVGEELRRESPRTERILVGSLARINRALLINVISWLGNSKQSQGRQLALIAQELNEFTREHPIETTVRSSTPAPVADNYPRPTNPDPFSGEPPRSADVRAMRGGPFYRSGTPEGVMAPQPAAAPVGTPSVNDLYTRIRNIGPNNQPWYMSLIPAEIAATYTPDQISVAVEDGQIVIEAHPNGQPVSFRIKLKVYPEGGFIEITDVDVMLTGGVGESNFAAQELTVVNRLLEGLRQIGAASQGAYQNVFINGVSSYYELYTLAWSGFSYVGDAATAAQVRAQVAQIENQVLQAIVDGQINMTGDRAQDLVTINQYIIDNNLWPNDLQMGGRITADAIPPIGAEQWAPVAASAVPSTPRVPIEPGQTMIYYYNSTWFYSVTMAADGQSVTLSNKYSTVEIHEGIPDIGAGIRPFMIYLKDGQLYMADQSRLPSHQATSNGRPLQMGETIIYYRDAIDPTIDYRAGIAQQMHLPGTAEVSYLGYKYTLLSLSEGHIQITRQSPSGEIVNLGELGLNENFGPFFAGPSGVVFFPYEATVQGINLVSPGPEAVLPAAPTADLFDHGIYTSATYISLNRYLLSLHRDASWVNVSFDLDQVEGQISAELRDKIQVQIYERLWAIAKEAGISSPVIVMEGDSFSISIPDILGPEVKEQIKAAIDQALAMGISATYVTTDAENGTKFNLIELQGQTAVVTFDSRQSHSDAELLAALSPEITVENPATIEGIPISMEGADLLAQTGADLVRLLGAIEAEQNLGIKVSEIVFRNGYFELIGEGGNLIDLDGVALESASGMPDLELRANIHTAIRSLRESGVGLTGVFVDGGNFMIYGTNNRPINVNGMLFKLSGEIPGNLNHAALMQAWDLASGMNLNPIGAVVHGGGSFEIELDSGHVLDRLMLEKISLAWEQSRLLGLNPASVNVLSEHFEIINAEGEVVDLIGFAQNGGLTPEQIATRTPDELRAMAAADLRAFNPELFVAPGEYRTIKIGENLLRVVNLGGRYMVAVSPEGAGQDLVWQPLPLSGELALDGGRVIVGLENGNVSARTVDVQAELTASFAALLQAGNAQLNPGVNNLKIENGRVRLATEREVPDAFLTLMPSGRLGVVIANQDYEGLQEGFSSLVRDYNSALATPTANYAGVPPMEPIALVMPEGFEDLKYRIGNEAAEILAPHLAGQERLDTRGLIRALRKFRDTGEITGALAELDMPTEQLEQLQGELIEVHGDYVRGRVYRFGKIEEAINNGESMDQATIEANLETLRRIAAQPDLAALIGADRLAALQTKLEAKLSTTPGPSAPATPIANPIIAVLMNDYHLTAAQVELVMRLFTEQGLSEQEFISKLAEIAPDLAANVSQLKEKLNQAILAQLTARAAADPEAAARLQEQFAMHGGRLGVSDIVSEIGQEYLQEDLQNGIAAVLGSNSPILQFLLEPVVEAEFWTSLARGQFGALKEFFSTSMPATGAGIVGASVYNVLLNIFGVSKDSWARGVLPQVTVGVLSAMSYTALASGTATSTLGRTLSRLLSNPVTQRLFVALSLNPIITDGVARLFGVTDEFEVGGRIARQSHPLAYDIISSLPGVGKEYATGLINIFDPDATYDYEMGLAERSAQAEITGQNIIDALSALTLLYIAQNPPVFNPELYGDIPHLEITDNPEVTDPEYYRQLVGYLSQAIAAQGPQGFDPALLGGTEELLPLPPAGLNLAEAAYTMLVGIGSGADISGQIPVYQALGLMDGQGRPIEGNSYVEEGRQLLASRRQNEEETGLVHEIARFIEHEGAEAIDLIQDTNREVDQAEVTGLIPTIDVNLPMELLADIRGVENIDPAQLMEYVIEQNQEAIDDLKAAQQKIIDTLRLISRALAGEAVDIDFSDPTVQAVLKYLKNRLPAQP
ncbi:GGDEF domain-containing protein [Candidatus Saganbacteria bacterium]|nr:GGDEF domain-containing protein [Candidatus Saganbacteria bacterium]